MTKNIREGQKKIGNNGRKDDLGKKEY